MEDGKVEAKEVFEIDPKNSLVPTNHQTGQEESPKIFDQVFFYEKKIEEETSNSSKPVSMSMKPSSIVAFASSVFWLFIKKTIFAKFLIVLISLASLYFKLKWFVIRKSANMSFDRPLLISTRSCQISISDTFDFSEVQFRTISTNFFEKNPIIDFETNSIWLMNQGETANCQISIPLSSSKEEIMITCFGSCLVQVYSAKSTSIETLILTGDSITVKARDIEINKIIASGRNLSFFSRDLLVNELYVSGLSVEFRNTFVNRSGNFLLGYVQDTSKVSSNMKQTSDTVISYSSFLQANFVENFFKLSGSPFSNFVSQMQVTETTPIQAVCLSSDSLPCSSQSSSYLIISNRTDIKLDRFTPSDVESLSLDSGDLFSISSEEESQLIFIANNTSRNNYFIIEMNNMNFERLLYFRAIIYRGWFIPFAAENFLQISDTEMFHAIDPIEKISLNLKIKGDEKLFEFLSLETKKKFFDNLKTFLIEKIEESLKAEKWNVIIVHPEMNSLSKTNSEYVETPEVRLWVILNSLIIIPCILVIASLIPRCRRFINRTSRKQSLSIFNKEILLRQISKEIYMFVNIGEIVKGPSPVLIRLRRFPQILHNYFLDNFTKKLSIFQFRSNEVEFIDLVTCLQSPSAENKIEFSRFYDACYNYLTRRGIPGYVLSQQVLQEALLKAGFLLKTNPNDPEFHIISQQIIGFQRGALFKDKLFLSMDQNINSLDYFIYNHCKSTKKDSESISLMDFSAAYSVFCSATSAHKIAFDEVYLEEIYGFKIKKVLKLIIHQGPVKKDGSCVSLKVGLIEAMSKNIHFENHFGGTSALMEKTELNRPVLLFVIPNLLEVWTVYLFISVTSYFPFLFESHIIPFAMTMLNERLNVELIYRKDVDSDVWKYFFLFMNPFYISDFFCLFMAVTILTNGKLEWVKKISYVLTIMLVLIVCLGVFLSIFSTALEILMLIFASHIGVHQFFDFVIKMIKFVLTLFAYFYGKMRIVKYKKDLKTQIDFFFSSLINDYHHAKFIRDKNKEANINAKKETANEVVQAWVEQEKSSLNYSLQKTKVPTALAIKSMKSPLNQENLRSFLSIALEVSNESPIVNVLFKLIVLKTQKFHKKDFQKKLKNFNHQFFAAICEEDQKKAELFSNFTEIFFADQNSDSRALLDSTRTFLKSIVDQEFHIVVESLVPIFLEICYGDFFSNFDEKSSELFQNFLEFFCPTSEKEKLSKIYPLLSSTSKNSPYHPQRHIQVEIPNPLIFWEPISDKLSHSLVQSLEESNSKQLPFFSEMFKNINGSREWRNLAELYGRVYNIDHLLLTFICELILGFQSKEVNLTSINLNRNPYFKAMKNKFKISGLYLSGVVNISRDIFDSESSSYFIIKLLQKSSLKIFTMSYQFIHLIFNRKARLKKLIKIMNVVEPKLFYYCLTAKTVNLVRAFDYYSQKTKPRKDFLLGFCSDFIRKNMNRCPIETSKQLKLEDPQIFEFYEFFYLFVKIRNFDFDMGIRKLLSVSRRMPKLDSEDEINLMEVILALKALRMKTDSPHFASGTLEAIKAVSIIENLKLLTPFDMENHFGFLVEAGFDWKIVFNFIKIFLRYLNHIENINSGNLDQILIHYLTDEVRVARRYQSILVQMKSFLQPNELPHLQSIDFDSTSFTCNTKSLDEVEALPVDSRNLIHRVISYIRNMYFNQDIDTASILYGFYYLTGKLKKEKVPFSTQLEAHLASVLSVQPIFIRTLGLLVYPQRFEDPNELVVPLKELLLSNKKVASDFQLKSVIHSIFRTDFIDTINKIVSGQNKLDKFFDEEIKEKALSLVLRFLLELKIQKRCQNLKVFQFSQLIFEKYALDVKEVSDLFKLCKRKGVDFVEVFAETSSKELVDIIRSFLLAQSKLQLPDEEYQKRYLQDNSSIFKLLGFDGKICWSVLLAKRGNFKLMRRFQRTVLKDPVLNGPLLMDLLEELLELTKRAKSLLNKKPCSEILNSPLLQTNALIEKLLNTHSDTPTFKALTKNTSTKIPVFSYIIFLTLKYADLKLLDYLFDLQFFRQFDTLVKKFRSEFGTGLKVKKALNFIEADRKNIFAIFNDLVKNKEIFFSYIKLTQRISPNEKLYLNFLLGDKGNPETNYNIAINTHLLQGWRERVKDETMLRDIDNFLKNTFSRPLQYYLFEEKTSEADMLLVTKTYFISFTKFLVDNFAKTLIDLANLSTEQKQEENSDSSNFGGSFFIQILISRLAELQSLDRDNIIEQYPLTIYTSDLLFRFIEKNSFVSSQFWLIQKEHLLKSYLFSFGLFLRPHHSLTLSPSIMTPSAFVYLHYQFKKSNFNEIESFHDLSDSFSKMSFANQFEFKIKLFYRILDKDIENSRNGQPLQLFRRFVSDGGMQGETLVGSDYRITLDHEKSLDLSLYKQKVFVDLPLLESFHVVDVVVRGRKDSSFFNLFRRLNPSNLDKNLYEITILKSSLTRSKFKFSVDDLFKFFFGLNTQNDEKVFKYIENYHEIGKSCKVFDIVIGDVFDYSDNGISFHMIDSNTKEMLSLVNTLQMQAKSWESDNFVFALKKSKIQLKSDLMVIAVVFEYLFYPGLPSMLIRIFQHFRLLQHHEQLGQDLDDVGFEQFVFDQRKLVV